MPVEDSAALKTVVENPVRIYVPDDIDNRIA